MSAGEKNLGGKVGVSTRLTLLVGSQRGVFLSRRIGTFDYFDLKPDDFNYHRPLAAAHFLVNSQMENIRRLLDRWVDCGVLDCRTCMAPLGSSKRDDANGGKYN